MENSHSARKDLHSGGCVAPVPAAWKADGKKRERVSREMKSTGARSLMAVDASIAWTNVETAIIVVFFDWFARKRRCS